MYFKALTRAATAAMTVFLAAGVATAAEGELAGSWRVDVTCRDFKQVNNVTIGQADMSKVLGTTNVGDGFGKIVAGQFDGKNFVFLNEYSFEGRTYTETWRGSLNNGGRSLRGKFETTHTAAGGCTFRGRSNS